MKREDLIALIKDWRVALLIILVIVSLIAIYPHFEDGKLVTNLQYGLDLQKGAWLQMELNAEVVGYDTSLPLETFVTNLNKELDTEVIVVDDNHLEIRKPFTQSELEAAFTKSGGTLTSYKQGVSKSTADLIKRTLENKINTLGTKDARVNVITDLGGVTRYIRVELAGVDMNEAQEVVGKQGKFEIRIVTTGNQTEHVLYGDTITSVGNPSQESASSKVWGVSFTLNDEGAQAIRDASIKYGAVTDPSKHNLVMLLDNQQVYSAPLSSDLASKMAQGEVKQLYASTGTGSDGLTDATNLEIHLRAGALPVEVTVAGSGSVSATLGDHFKWMCVLAAILAIITVGCVVYFRYREPAIVLPMMAINCAELIILLGIARFIQQLDLASIAGLIAVLGTGIDQLVIVTDEILHEGKVPSPNLYMKRLARALGIILASAATVVIAMLPLALMDLSTLRGFAIITILGVLVGVLITRPAYGKIIMTILSK